MLVNQILEFLMKITNTTKAGLARKLKCSRSAIHQRLKQKNMSIDTLDEILDELGYRLVIVPKDEQVNGYPLSGKKKPLY